MKNGSFKVIQLAFPIILIIVGLMWFLYNPGLVGGELHAPDFENGYSLYVRESHDLLFSRDEGFRVTPHTIWMITDENTKDTIYELCGDLISYREFFPERDVMAGTPEKFAYLPQIYFVTESYGYYIGIINWESYAGPGWNYLPIKNEIFGIPALRVWRADLSLKPDDEDLLDFLDTYHGADSVNREGSGGWYSTMPQAGFDALLSLLSGVDSTIAEVFATIE